MTFPRFLDLDLVAIELPSEISACYSLAVKRLLRSFPLFFLSDSLLSCQDAISFCWGYSTYLYASASFLILLILI